MNAGIKEGLSQYARDEAPNAPKDVKPEYRYPRGWIPAGCILAVMAVILGVGLGYSIPKGAGLQTYEVAMIAFVVSFALCVAWLIARQNFALQSRYSVSKIAKQLTAYR